MTQGTQVAVDFKHLAEQVQDESRRWGQAKLAIWGGWCSVDDVLSLVNRWPQRDEGMPYHIWEYTSKIVFEDKDDPLPSSEKWLERGRLFGVGGDLSLRRNGDQFFWHFVGKPGTQPPDGNFHAESFWKVAPANTTFHYWEENALLWGERREGHDLWFEDRVAQARLAYPIDELGRVQVHYCVFSRVGRVELVWLTKLSPWEGAE